MAIIKSRGIRSETELLALANERADEDLDDLKTLIAENQSMFTENLSPRHGN